MSDVAKWVLLGAVVIAALVSIVALPMMNYNDTAQFDYYLGSLFIYVGDWFVQGRALINLFLDDWSIGALSGLLVYLFFKPIVVFGLKLPIMIYHWIFK